MKSRIRSITYKTLFFIAETMDLISHIIGDFAWRLQQREMDYRYGQRLIKSFQAGGPNARRELKNLGG